MNIIEVLKTGKNVYAPFSFSYMSIAYGNFSPAECSVRPQVIDRDYFIKAIFPGLSEKDLLRDDWDVEPVEPEKKIEITKSQLERAIRSADAAETFFPYSPANKAFLNRVAKELGLE